MKRLSRLILQYYRILLPYNLIFTVLWLVFALFGFRELNAVVWFWAVVCAFWSAVTIHWYTTNESYFYFRNAGFRMRRIITLAFFFDLLLFFIITFTYYAIQNIKG